MGSELVVRLSADPGVAKVVEVRIRWYKPRPVVSPATAAPTQRLLEVGKEPR